MGHANIATTQRYLHAIPRNRKLPDTLNPMAADSDIPFRKALGPTSVDDKTSQHEVPADADGATREDYLRLMN